MEIINKTKNTLLAKDIVIANTPFKRMKGLLGKKDFKAGQALILKPCNSIHTFFLRFAIDVIFVDKDNKIIEAISRLKPFCFTPIFWLSSLVIELPAGIIQSSSTYNGDTLTIEGYPS